MMKKMLESSRYGAILEVYSEWLPIAFRLLGIFWPSGTVGIAPIYQSVGNAVAEWQQRSKLLHDEHKEVVVDNMLCSVKGVKSIFL